MLGLSLSPTVHDTSALYAGTTTPGANALAGGSFSPGVAPPVTRTARGVNTQLSWPAVTFSSGTAPAYLVTRIQQDGTQHKRQPLHRLPRQGGFQAPVPHLA